MVLSLEQCQKFTTLKFSMATHIKFEVRVSGEPSPTKPTVSHVIIFYLIFFIFEHKLNRKARLIFSSCKRFIWVKRNENMYSDGSSVEKTDSKANKKQIELK